MELRYPRTCYTYVYQFVIKDFIENMDGQADEKFIGGGVGGFLAQELLSP